MTLKLQSFSSEIEAVNFNQSDGKQPDEITLFSFKDSKWLVWDSACCCCIVSSGSFIISALDLRSATWDAKLTKYVSLVNTIVLALVAVKISDIAHNIRFQNVNRKASSRRNKPCEIEWLMQHILLVIFLSVGWTAAERWYKLIFFKNMSTCIGLF